MMAVKGGGVGIAWQDAHLGTLHHTAAKLNASQPASRPEQIALYQFTLGCFTWNTCTRRLVNQSYGHFMRLQDQVEAETSSGAVVSAEALVKCSQLYRSALHECVLGLRDGGPQYSEEASLYAMMELAWHLCEVLYIEVLPAGCLIQQLLEWVRWHGSSGEGELREVLSEASPENSEEYWKNVYRLTLRGQLAEAGDVLLHHSRASQPAFTSMLELLHAAPMLLSTVGFSRAMLHHCWADWKKRVNQRRERGEFISYPGLELLAKVLYGDEDAFQEKDIASCVSQWYELMVGKLLFTCPLVVTSDYELCYTAEWARRASTDCSNGDLTALLLAALCNDFIKVIQSGSVAFGNWWFVAHLANIFQHKGLLTALKSDSNLSEFLLLEYASSLMSHSSLWQVAMDYLARCSSQGHHYMSLLLERVPLTSDRKANKVLHLCQRYNLKDQAKSVCKVLAVKAYKGGRLGTALSWSIRAKDSEFAAFLVEKYMENFESLGEFMDLDLLDYLGDAMLLNGKLLFLAKYREYHQLYGEEEYDKASNLLISLLTSDSFPQRFLFTLLKDALNLLQIDKVVFSSEQTYSLSHFMMKLSDLTSQQDQTICYPKVEDEVVSSLRLALVKNLSRALMEEAA